MAQKIAFITGGNRGLGFQTALDLGKNKEENIKVVIGSRDKAQGEQAVDETSRGRRRRRHDPVRHHKSGRLSGRLQLLRLKIWKARHPGEQRRNRRRQVPGRGT